MAYEKTIGGRNLIYTLTLTGSFKLLVDCLSATDRTELEAFMFNNGAEQAIIVDGYLTSQAKYYISHKVGGAFEVIAAGDRYPVPAYQWPYFTMAKGDSGSQPAIIRILLSASEKNMPSIWA